MTSRTLISRLSLTPVLARPSLRSSLAIAFGRSFLGSRSDTSPDREPPPVAPRRDVAALVAGPGIGDGPAVAVQHRVDGVRPGGRGGVFDGGSAHGLGHSEEPPVDGGRPVVDVVTGDQHAA